MFSKLRDKIEKIMQVPVEDDDLYFSNSKILLKLAAKEFLIVEGEICSKLAFIQQGELRMFYKTQDGKEINIEFFFENDFVTSYQSFIKQRPNKYFIQALTDCELITISYDALQNAYANSFYWQKFGRIIAEIVYSFAEQRSESFLFQNAEERYLTLLRNRPNIFEKIPLYHIASYLGIERESLSRLRKKLAKSTIVT